MIVIFLLKYKMNHKNAMIILGSDDLNSRSEINKAFKDRVSEIVQKNYPTEKFKNAMDQLYTACHVSSEYIKEKQQKLVNYNYNYNYINDEHQQIDNVQPIQFDAKNYRFTKSYSRSIKYDSEGNAIGKINKVVQENDKVYKEEKEFNTKNNIVKVKKYKPDGTIQEYEKPISGRIENKN